MPPLLLGIEVGQQAWIDCGGYPGICIRAQLYLAEANEALQGLSSDGSQVNLRRILSWCLAVVMHTETHSDRFAPAHCQVVIAESAIGEAVSKRKQGLRIDVPVPDE